MSTDGGEQVLTVEEVPLRLQDLDHVVEPRSLYFRGRGLHDEVRHAAVGPARGQGQAAGVPL